MAAPFAKSLLKIAVAQICQNIGWNAVQSTPLELLVDILHRHLLELSKATHNYSNQYGRSEPNLLDLSLAFRSMGIKLKELEDYITNVEPVPFAHKVAAFPIPNPSNFQFPKQGSKEVANRPEWIHEYLPLMNPELEEDEMAVAEPGEEMQKPSGRTSPFSSGSEDVNPSSPRTLAARKSHDTVDSKKAKLISEEEGRPMREVASVFMTPSGIITFARDSKLPDPRPPPKIEEPKPRLPDTSSSSESLPSHKVPKEMKKDKVKILKMKKNLMMKSKLKKLMILGKDGKDKSDKIRKHGDIFHKKSFKIGDEIMKVKSKKKTSKDMERSSKHKQPIGKIKIAKDVKMKAKDFSLKIPKIKHKLPKSPPRVAMFSTFPGSPKLPKVPKLPIKVKPVEKPVKPVDNLPVKIEPLQHALQVNTVVEDEVSRDDTPEPRLVIDDEAQARQEKESRLAVLDECIDAVIQRARETIELENVESDKNMNATIDAVVKNSVPRKLEPRDVYDFTDSSNGSNPPTPKTPEPPCSPVPVPKIKKEKKSPPEIVPKLSPELNKKKKTKSKKSKSKEGKSNKIAKQNQIFFNDSELSSDDIQLTPSPVPINMAHQSSAASLFSAMNVPKFSTLGLNQSPYTPVIFPPMNAFPTPPLFVPPMQQLPMNLPMSPQPPCGQSSLANLKTAAEKKDLPPLNLTIPKIQEKKVKTEEEPPPEKVKSKKEQKKEKSKKKSKEKSKEKVKEEVAPPVTPCVSPPRPPSPKPVAPPVKSEPVPVIVRSPPAPKIQTPKPKAEKKEKGKTKGKGKTKVLDEKDDQDSIPKLTFKLGSNSANGQISSSGSTKIVIKSSANKTVPKSKSPSPVREPSPPKPPPSPPTPPPPAPVVVQPPSPPPHVISPQLPPSISGTRGRHGGRGRGAAKRVPSPPPAPSCTVITETLGTIVDESGNKIWICPACTRPDDGSPMIGCDECDDWYHWVCVGIVVPPKEEESWFCSRCITKRQSPIVKRKRKKHKKEK